VRACWERTWAARACWKKECISGLGPGQLGSSASSRATNAARAATGVSCWSVWGACTAGHCWGSGSVWGPWRAPCMRKTQPVAVAHCLLPAVARLELGGFVRCTARRKESPAGAGCWGLNKCQGSCMCSAAAAAAAVVVVVVVDAAPVAAGRKKIWTQMQTQTQMQRWLRYGAQSQARGSG
jgi:hypothetical protein